MSLSRLPVNWGESNLFSFMYVLRAKSAIISRKRKRKIINSAWLRNDSNEFVGRSSAFSNADRQMFAGGMRGRAPYVHLSLTLTIIDEGHYLGFFKMELCSYSSDDWRRRHKDGGWTQVCTLPLLGDSMGEREWTSELLFSYSLLYLGICPPHPRSFNLSHGFGLDSSASSYSQRAFYVHNRRRFRRWKKADKMFIYIFHWIVLYASAFLSAHSLIHLPLSRCVSFNLQNPAGVKKSEKIHWPTGNVY